jgi:DNA-binding transcriptional LysR family regulator
MPDPGDAHVRDLRSFLTVADELSFTRAAELLFVSQPALSK